MNRTRHLGFSLVELMIAILLAAVTAIVVLNVLTSYQSRSNTVTGRNDAEISAAMGLFSIEKEIRMSGAGLATPRGPLCPSGVNLAWGGAAVSDSGPLMPVRIIDGGTAPDSIEMVRSDSEFGAAPTRLVAAMASSTSQIAVDGSAGLRLSDLVLVGAPDRAVPCTIMQLTANPTANGSGWLLTHAAGIGNYNPSDPPTTFSNAIAYQVRDVAVNLGRYGVRRYGVVCNDADVPSVSNNCDAGWWNPLSNATPALANINSVASDIIDMQAQYGVSPTPTDPSVNEWVDATGATWAAPTLNNARRIRAVRISIVSRGAREGRPVDTAPTTLYLWDRGGAGELRRDLTSDEQRFRYQVLTVVVPLINSIWTGS
jgi:type IV pilus assembly protein PilW